MKVTMLVNTYFFGKKYREGKEYDVEPEVAGRWARNKIAVVDEEATIVSAEVAGKAMADAINKMSAAADETVAEAKAKAEEAAKKMAETAAKASEAAAKAKAGTNPK